jgi:hypothetical protein
MSTPLKFEFDFDEVFEGIKQGVIRELSEANFEDAKTVAINQIKTEIRQKISLTYGDYNGLKNEVKNEIKEKVFDSVIEEVNNKYFNHFKDYIESQLSKNPERLKEVIGEIKAEVEDRMYSELYSDIKQNLLNELRSSFSTTFDVFSGNSIKINGSDKTISKEEYKELLDRDRKLSALEAGGVDNWQWYGESLEQYYNEKE